MRRSDGLWDWRIIAANGEIVATSGGQGFTERNDAAEGMQRVLDAEGAILASGEIDVEPPE